MNSEIYCNEESNNYFDRNKAHRHSYFIDYLLGIFPKDKLKNMDVAEFGIGNGSNLLFLKDFCNKAHGYEAANLAVDYFKNLYKNHCFEKDFDCMLVNLAKPFDGIQKYDLIVFGFFPYYCNDAEMKVVMENTLKLLKKDSYVYIFDFLVKKEKVKNDSRNQSLKVYKRDLDYWIKYFNRFSLMDFRLFDSNKTNFYETNDNLGKIDVGINKNDDDWYFSALFKKD